MNTNPETYKLAPIRPLLAPKYWPSWLVVGLLWLFSRLPFAWGMALSRSLKPLLKLLLKKRAAIAEQNIRACFPDMDDTAVANLLDQHFTGLASMVGEIIYSWWGSKALFDRIGTICGLEHIEAAKAAGHAFLANALPILLKNRGLSLPGRTRFRRSAVTLL